jgi:biopolymer transport protein ExbD
MPDSLPNAFDDELYTALVSKPTVRDDVDMDVTPMIDITFLLLIFFLVASRMDVDTQVQLPPANHGTAVAAKNSVIITIAAGENGAVFVYKGDGTDANNLVPGDDLEAQEAEIREFVDEAINGPEAKEQVIIKAARHIKHRDVARVSRAAGANGARLFVAVLET